MRIILDIYMGNWQPFIKNETSYSLTNHSYGDYLGTGVQTSNKTGKYQFMLAGKATSDNVGGFAEFKYATPEIAPHLRGQIRERYFVMDNGNQSSTLVGGVYSNNFGKNFNIYEIAGTNIGVSSKGFDSVTPISITGVGYKINDNMSIYTELDVSKGYNLKNKNWNNPSAGVTLGFSATF